MLSSWCFTWRLQSFCHLHYKQPWKASSRENSTPRPPSNKVSSSQITAEDVFCCYNNSCNGSLALCAAEMSAFEVNGKGNVGSQQCFWECDIIRGKETVWCFQQFSPGAPVGWCTVSYSSLCSETSTVCLPAICSFFLVVFVVMETTCHSLVIGQLSKRRLT